MVTTKLKLSMTEPQVRQIYAKQGDTGRVLDITLDQTPEDGTLRILRPDGVEVTSEAVAGGEISESGETVSFESLTEADVTELSVGIEPVQDLNGYDKPWVGGAGKNKMPITATSRTVSGVNITFNDDGSFRASGTATADIYLNLGDASASANTWIASCGVISTWNTYGIYIRNVTDNVTINMINVQNYTFTLSDTKTIRFILFIKSGQTVNTDFYPMLRLATETDPTWQPYSNICPITGHDEVTVTRTGINVWDGESEAGYIDLNTGNEAASSSNQRSKYVRVFPSTTYCYTNETVQTGIRIAYYDANKVFVGTYANGANTPQTFTTPSKAFYMRFYWADISKVSINYPSADHDYHAYQGSTYTTSLGQTVYGGTLDMVTGQLVVDKGYAEFDGDGNEDWYLGAYGYGNYRAYIAVSGIDTTVEDANVADIASNQFGAISHSAGVSATGISSRKNIAQINVFQSVISTVTSWREHLATNPLQVVYKLATPTTIKLTPQQIKTLVGTNNVWASSGDIVNIKFTYGGLLSELPSDATSIVGKCYCDVEQSGVSSMPFTLNVKKNERAT